MLVSASVVVLVFATVAGGDALGASGRGAPYRAGGGTNRSGGDKVVREPIPPVRVIQNARYQTGGTGLRNQRRGGITINGVAAPPLAAIIYWAFITTGPPGAAQSSVTVQRRAPTMSGAVVVPGTVVGAGPDPCWAGDTITVWRGVVPLAVASGSGFYEVTLNPGSASSFAGEDPYVPPFTPAPLAEGASMVIFYPGAGTTAIYDMGLSGITFFSTPGLTYTLALPFPAPGGLTLWDNIGADGQHTLVPPGVDSRSAVLSMSDEATTINGVPVAGPASPYVDSDWNGNDSNPLPELWDTTGHEITAATPPGMPTLTVAVASASGAAPFDCLTTVANIVMIA
jgi:hypothetical protein